MPGRAGAVAPRAALCYSYGKYSLSETDAHRSANDANEAWAAGPITSPEGVRSGISERTVAETRSNREDALIPAIPGCGLQIDDACEDTRFEPLPGHGRCGCGTDGS